MEWLRKLSDAIAYIEQNLDAEISYEEAARIACCSPYYFQRMFSYVAGISLSDYIRRRRMSQAAFDLQRCDARVLDVALKYGYTSPTAFNRAFQKVHGIPPTAAKNIGKTLHAYPPIQFSVNITGGSPMAYHIAEKRELRFAGIRIRLCEEMEENHKIVPHFWKETMQSPQYTELCQLSDTGTNAIFGISVYEDPDHIFYYIAVATSKKIPSRFHELRIPAATWAVFENKGNFKENVQDISAGFIPNGCCFPVMNMHGFPISKHILCRRRHHTTTNAMYGLPFIKKRRRNMEYKIEIREIEPLCVAYMSYEGDVTKANRVFPKVFQSIHGKTNGAPFFNYLSMNPETKQGALELCVPTDEVPCTQDIEVKQMPRIKAVCVTHIGSYATLPLAYAAIDQYAVKHSLKISAPFREVFIKGPGMLFKGNPKKYITEIQFPILEEA